MARQHPQGEGDYLVTSRPDKALRIECRKTGRQSVAEIAINTDGSVVVEVQAPGEPMALGWGHAQVDLGPPALLRQVLELLVTDPDVS